MTEGKAGFYLAFGPDIGLGHLVRSAALAARLSALGWSTVLLRESDAPLPAFCAHLYDEQCDAHSVSATSFDWLVADHCRPDAHIFARFGVEAQILLIHDTAEQDIAVGDVVLNQNLRHRRNPSRADQTLLLGPSYALLRPAFARLRPRAPAPQERRTLERVMIAPGATDPEDVTGRLLPELTKTGLAIDVLLSSVAQNTETTRSIAAAHRKQVRLIVDADDSEVADATLSADLVIGNGGSGIWERCVLGTPSMALEMAENQRGNIRKLSELGAAIPAGHGSDETMPQTVLRVIEELRSAPDKLGQVSAAALKVCDGLGTNRVAAVIAPCRLQDNRTVTLRLAEMDDLRMVYDWQSLPETRRYARNPGVPSWEEHRSWFAGKLADHRAIMNVIEVDREPAGMVRLDYIGDRQDTPIYELSIFLSPYYYGQRIASCALKLVSQMVPFCFLKAYVTPANEKSMTLFRRAGYKLEMDGFYLSPKP